MKVIYFENYNIANEVEQQISNYLGFPQGSVNALTGQAENQAQITERWAIVEEFQGGYFIPSPDQDIVDALNLTVYEIKEIDLFDDTLGTP